MSDAVDIWEKPESEEIYMLLGWRQWADAGSISSGLPRYLIQETEARQIGTIRPDGFYLFQIPGTHDLVRPTIHFEDGFPKALETPRNELYYAGDGRKGIVFFIGDEPQIEAERYVAAILEAARQLGVKRLVSFGGVYGELPYDKARTVSGIYSLPPLKEEMEQLAVNLSDYQGGASIGSYLCRRASEQEIAYTAFYAFVPTYDFTHIEQIGNTIRLENDFMAWLGVMRRVNYMLKLDIDLADLEERSRRVVKLLDEKVDELDTMAPELGVRDYMDNLSANFNEVSFEALSDVWEEAFDHLFDDTEGGN